MLPTTVVSTVAIVAVLSSKFAGPAPGAGPSAATMTPPDVVLVDAAASLTALVAGRAAPRWQQCSPAQFHPRLLQCWQSQRQPCDRLPRSVVGLEEQLLRLRYMEHSDSNLYIGDVFLTEHCAATYSCQAAKDVGLLLGRAMV